MDDLDFITAVLGDGFDIALSMAVEKQLEESDSDSESSN